MKAIKYNKSCMYYEKIIKENAFIKRIYNKRHCGLSSSIFVDKNEAIECKIRKGN